MIEVARRWPTILEIHSDDKFEWNLHPFYHRVMGTLFRSSLLTRIAGMVMVAPELIESSNFRVKKVPTTTIPNGIRIPADIKYDACRERQPGPSRLVLSVGNTLPWQGIDKFFALALRLPDLDFHLLGLSANQVPAFPKNVTINERMLPAEIGPFLSTMDIGFGNLALEKDYGPSPSPLKVREYVAAGLPCIVAHDDPDLEGQEGILNLGYGFTDLKQASVAVKAFARHWTGRTCSRTMADSVSLVAKEAQRLEFFETVLKMDRPKRRA